MSNLIRIWVWEWAIIISLPNARACQPILVRIGYVDIEIKQDTHLTVSEKHINLGFIKIHSLKFNWGNIVHIDTHSHARTHSAWDATKWTRQQRLSANNPNKSRVLFSMTNKLDSIQHNKQYIVCVVHGISILFSLGFSYVLHSFIK